MGILLAFILTGCSGVKPYNPPDYRNEGTGKGLFSGEDGEFVIYQTGEVPEKRDDAREQDKKPD